jgi:hypothetical protein
MRCGRPAEFQPEQRKPAQDTQKHHSSFSQINRVPFRQWSRRSFDPAERPSKERKKNVKDANHLPAICLI